MFILIAYHSGQGHALALARAVAQGVAGVDGVEARLMPALEAGAEELISSAGVVFCTPEYFGCMAGGLKDFFDRTYEPARREQSMVNKAYGLVVAAGNDGEGARTSVERICQGYPLKQVCPPVISLGEAGEDALEQCRELGATIAAGCEFGIF